MKRLVISVGVVLAISLAVDASAKEPVLMLNEPRDIYYGGIFLSLGRR